MTKRSADLYLFAILGDQQLVDTWWNSPNRAFDNKHPIEVWTLNSNDVKMYILSMMEGEW